MQCTLTLVFVLLSCASLCSTLCNYKKFKHIQPPIPVLNSAYRYTEADGFCCPLHKAESECIPDEKMLCRCEHGLVPEPCHHCNTCAKGLGEICGGLFGAIGRCAEGLVCKNHSFEFMFLDGANITAVCESKDPPVLKRYERCGPKYGVCEEGTNCTEVVPAANVWRCRALEDPVQLKPNCNKDCSKLRTSTSVCGTDGRNYSNVCFLRQQNCGADPYKVVRKANDPQLCTKFVCPDISTPKNGLVHFSTLGVKTGSVVNITCYEGYSLYNGDTPLHLSNLEINCFGRQWEPYKWSTKESMAKIKCVYIGRTDEEKKTMSCGTDLDASTEPATSNPTQETPTTPPVQTTDRVQNIQEKEPTRSNEA